MQIGRFRLKVGAKATPKAFLAIGAMVGIILLGSALNIAASSRRW